MEDDILRGDAKKHRIDLEKGFKLPLPTLVEGKDLEGKQFAEETTLSYISHQGSSFWLKSRVAIGSQLKLSIDLPPKLSEDKRLKLIIRGRVAFIEITNSRDLRQRVSLKFENKYVIKRDEK